MMNKNYKLLGVVLIAGALLLYCSVAFARKAGNDLIKSYWLTEKVLIVGYGDLYYEPIVAVNTVKGIVIVDSGSSPSLTTAYRSVIERELGRSDFKYLINTHSHGDHYQGNQVFKEAEIIAHKFALKKMKENSDFYEKEVKGYNKKKRETIKRRNLLKKTLKKNSGLYKRISARNYIEGKMCDDYETIFKLTLPSITFTDHLTLDMGDLKIHLVYFGPGFHSGNDIIISIPEEKIVLTGDIIAQKDPFAESFLDANSNFNAWITSLEKIFKNNSDIKHVVTFHFGVVPGKVIRDFYDSLKILQSDLKKKKSAVGWLRTMIAESGFFKAKQMFENNFKTTENEEYFIWEREILSLARDFLQKNKYDETIMVLNLCKRLFPNSVTAYNFLCSTYKKVGKRIPAIKACQKCLELDPINSAYIADLIFQLENSK